MHKTSPNSNETAFRAATRFATSPVLECCYALAHVCDGTRDRALHGAWTEATRRKLSPAFWRRFNETGAWPRIWTVLPDLLDEFDPQQSIEGVAERVRTLGPKELATQVVGGVLHPLPLVRRVVSGDLTLRAAVARTPTVHREWLLFSGLYPFDAAAPVARTLQYALDAPDRLARSLAAMLEEFWSVAFRDTWQFGQSQYERSVQEKARLQAACAPQQLADELRLRVEINLGQGYLQAVRGGYRLPLSRLGTAWLIPSAFNVHHFWHVLESVGREHPLFPYFDPSIEVGITSVADRGARRNAEPQIDPALVFRALADPARYSMMFLLGSAPRTATEIGASLSLSKGTISHHVHIMREAGLVTRSIEGNATLLRLNRGTLEQLSAETLRAVDADVRLRPRARKKAGARR